MAQTTMRRRGAFDLTLWRAAITGLVILCVSPVWAANICDCLPEQEPLHACCQTIKPSSLSENNQQNHGGEKTASHCQTTQSPTASSQVRKSAQHAMTCCEPTPPPKLENIELSPTMLIGAEERQPLPVAYHQHISQAPSFIHKPLRQSQRPLYMVVSCWLI